MPDWRREVSRKLANSKLTAAERADISRELSGYLEDLCSDARHADLDESAAAQDAAAQLHEDKHLGAHLYRARKKNPMNDRTKRLWLPGITMLIATIAILAVVQLAGLQPYCRAWLGGGSITPHALNGYISIYVPWLCVLPFLGAISAYWSRRAGSTRSVQVTAGLFPVLVFFAIFLVVVPFRFAFEGLPAVNASLAEIAGAVASWVVIPGAALLLGTLSFVYGSRTRRRLPS